MISIKRTGEKTLLNAGKKLSASEFENSLVETEVCVPLESVVFSWLIVFMFYVEKTGVEWLGKSTLFRSIPNLTAVEYLGSCSLTSEAAFTFGRTRYK